MPNSKRVKQYLPNGVIKVVRCWDSTASGICQKPEFSSNFVYTLAPASWARVWSTACSGCRSLRTLSLSLVRSTQMRTLSSTFGTTTIAEHQSVCSSTGMITCSFSILSNSAFTRGSRGIAIRLGVVKAHGLAPSFNWMHYSVFSRPNPLNNFGLMFAGFPFCFVMLSTRTASPSASITGRPRSGIWRCRTTYTFSLSSFSPLRNLARHRLTNGSFCWFVPVSDILACRRTIWGIFFNRLFGTTVTSAPVSILNVVLAPFCFEFNSPRVCARICLLRSS